MKAILLLLFSVSMFISCNSKEKEYKLIENISLKSLQKSNHALSRLSSENYQTLREKLRNENYGEHAVYWNNRASTLKTLTTKFLQQIEGLGTKSISKNDSLSILKHKYISDVNMLDSNLKKVFKSEMNSFLINNRMTISILFNVEKAKNDILILESQLSGYFSNKLGMIMEDYTRFSVLVSQNTSHLKPGEILEVNAGIGSFTVAAKPTFKINGETIFPDENATAVYKLKVEGRGEKRIPVEIKFISPDGQKRSKEVMLEYYVD